MLAVKCVLYALFAKIRVSIDSLEYIWDINGPDIDNMVALATLKGKTNANRAHTHVTVSTHYSTWTEGSLNTRLYSKEGIEGRWDRYRLVLRGGIFLLWQLLQVLVYCPIFILLFIRLFLSEFRLR